MEPGSDEGDATEHDADDDPQVGSPTIPEAPEQEVPGSVEPSEPDQTLPEGDDDPHSVPEPDDPVETGEEQEGIDWTRDLTRKVRMKRAAMAPPDTDSATRRMSPQEILEAMGGLTVAEFQEVYESLNLFLYQNGFAQLSAAAGSIRLDAAKLFNSDDREAFHK